MSFYKKYILPQLFKKDPEDAHDRVSWLLKEFGGIPLVSEMLQSYFTVRNPRLKQELWGLTFENPIGLAAGFDKTGESLPGWQDIGFGFLCGGGVTPLPQTGNQKPRVFRLVKDRAIINRMGLNGPGAEAVAEILRAVRSRIKVPLFINIGKGKDTPLENAPDDYAFVMGRLYPYGDAFVANVSSPNTKDLRMLQGKNYLDAIILEMQKKRERLMRNGGKQPWKPILVKIAHDLSPKETNEILEVCVERNVDGIIATNTTISREGVSDDLLAEEAGGLSGPPLFPKALEMVRYIHKKLPQFPIVGVGGISSANDAFKMFEAGARLLQVGTGLVYEGPGLPRDINRGLVKMFENRLIDMWSFVPEPACMGVPKSPAGWSED